MYLSRLSRNPWRRSFVISRPTGGVVRGRYVQDVDIDGPGSVTDVRWDVNTGTRCVPSRQCVCDTPRSLS